MTKSFNGKKNYKPIECSLNCQTDLGNLPDHICIDI